MSLFYILAIIGAGVYFIWSFILIVSPKKIDIVNNILPNDFKMLIMIPMLNEKDVARLTVEKFYKELSKDQGFNLDLLIIDDGSDDGTSETLKELEDQYNNLHVLYRKLPNARTGKGDALNNGLEYIKSIENLYDENMVIGIMDADAFISIDDLRNVGKIFSQKKNISMVQVTVGMNNIDSWLHIMQDFEFQASNYSIQNLRVNLGNAAASGNGQFFRVSCLPEKNAWGNSLLEDFEFSTKLILKGYKTYYYQQSVVYQEPVSTIKSFFKQRSRWAQGGIECISKYGKDIIKSTHLNKKAKFEMFFYMFLPYLTIFTIVGYLISTFNSIKNIILEREYSYLLIPIILIIVSLIICIYFGVLYSKRTSYSMAKSLAISLTIPIYNILLAPISYIAVIRHIRKDRSWDKTIHKNISNRGS